MIWVVLIVLLALLTLAVGWFNRKSKEVEIELDAAGIKSMGMFTRIQSNVQRRERDRSGPGSASGSDPRDRAGRGGL